MSGAGKTQAMNARGTWDSSASTTCLPTFLPQLGDLYTTALEQRRRVAVAMDARGQGVFADVAES